MADAALNVMGTERVLAKLEAMKDVRPLRQAVLSCALMVESSAKESIAHGSPSGRIYKRGSVNHQASAPGEPPASDGGELLSSITHWDETADGLVVNVGSVLPTARHLEFGTRKMAARPFLFPALDINRNNIIARIKQALAPKKGK